MSTLILVLRLVHVVAGALWAGIAIFTTVFLKPDVQETGREGGAVMAAVQRRGLMTVLPALALATIVSGLWLYWLVSGGLRPAFLTSPVGLGLGVGGLASMLAYALGIGVTRPAMIRVAELMEGLGSAPTAPDRETRLAEIQRLRARAAAAARVIAALLVLSLAGMAVARYL